MANRRRSISCIDPGLCCLQPFIFVIGVLFYEARIFFLLSDMIGYTVQHSVLNSKTRCSYFLSSMFLSCEESYRGEKPENLIFYILERPISDVGEEKLSENKKIIIWKMTKCYKGKMGTQTVKFYLHGFGRWTTWRIWNWLSGHAQRIVLSVLMSKWGPSGVLGGQDWDQRCLTPVGDMGSGIDAPSTSLPMTLSCVEGRGGASRGIWTGWASGRSIRLSARSYSWVRATPSPNTGWEGTGQRAALRRRTWGCWWMRNSTWPNTMHLQPKNQTYPGLQQNKWGQQVSAGDSSPLLCFHETPPGSLHSALDPNRRKDLLEEVRGGHEDDQGVEDRLNTPVPLCSPAAGVLCLIPKCIYCKMLK